MYNNIGAKIKIMAQVVAWVGITSSVISGFRLISMGMGIDADYFGELLIFMGLVTLIGGSLWAWILTWCLYGYGELIENSAKIVRNTAKESSGGSLTAKMENEEKLKNLITWRENNLISEEEFEIKKQELRGE